MRDHGSLNEPPPTFAAGGGITGGGGPCTKKTPGVMAAAQV
jgi:hypothetical protein